MVLEVEEEGAKLRVLLAAVFRAVVLPVRELCGAASLELCGSAARSCNVFRFDGGSGTGIVSSMAGSGLRAIVRFDGLCLNEAVGGPIAPRELVAALDISLRPVLTGEGGSWIFEGGLRPDRARPCDS